MGGGGEQFEVILQELGFSIGEGASGPFPNWRAEAKRRGGGAVTRWLQGRKTQVYTGCTVALMHDTGAAHTRLTVGGRLKI